MQRNQTLLILLFLAGTAEAGAAGLTAKPGLWERTTTTTMEGAAVAPSIDLSKMPPERRAKMEEMLAARNDGKPRTATHRSCVTPEMLQKWDHFTQDDNEKSRCERKVLEQSSSHFKMTTVCEGGKSTGTFEFTAASPESVAGHMTMVTHGDSGDRKVNITMTSRWLGADCGDLAPGKSARVAKP